MLPPVPAAQLPGFLADADAAPVLYVASVPYFRHALPNGVFNSIAAGLPILYPPDLVEVARLAEAHGLGVPIDPRDAGSIVSAVKELYDDRAHLAELAANVAAAKPRLAWSEEEPKLAAIVNDLIGPPEGSA